tara:strand:- start:156 stop:329 length:174 start_codon:yes stop_codon:yes gene_type:complete
MTTYKSLNARQRKYSMVLNLMLGLAIPTITMIILIKILQPETMKNVRSKRKNKTEPY